MTPELWAVYRQPMAAEVMASHWHRLVIQEHMETFSVRDPLLCVGCGDGTELQFAPPGSVGVTLNPAGLSASHRVVVADMHVLPFRDRSFVGIYCKDTFEHALAPTIVFAEFARVAREFIFLAIPNADWSHSVYHPMILTKDQLYWITRKAGWTVGHQSQPVWQEVPGKPRQQWVLDCYFCRPLTEKG